MIKKAFSTDSLVAIANQPKKESRVRKMKNLLNNRRYHLKMFILNVQYSIY